LADRHVESAIRVLELNTRRVDDFGNCPKLHLGRFRQALCLMDCIFDCLRARLIGDLFEVGQAELYAPNIGGALIEDLAHERPKSWELRKLHADRIAGGVTVWLLPNIAVRVSNSLGRRGQIDGICLDILFAYPEFFEKTIILRATTEF
jgi:hypothetical protein